MKKHHDVLPHVKLLLNTQIADLGDCWAEGYEAFFDQADELKNPYHAGTREHEYWREGWWASYFGEPALFELSIPIEALSMTLSDSSDHLVQVEPVKKRGIWRWLTDVRVAFGLVVAALAVEFAELMTAEFALVSLLV